MFTGFTDETVERQLEIVRSYRSILDGYESLHEPDANLTSGHWRRSVD